MAFLPYPCALAPSCAVAPHSPDYDLCADCEEREGILSLQPTPVQDPATTPIPSGRKHNPATHLLIKLRRPGQMYEQYYAVKNRAGLVHTGISCDACSSAIIGFRYKCTVRAWIGFT